LAKLVAAISVVLAVLLASCAVGTDDEELEVLVDGKSLGSLKCDPPRGTVRYPRFACAYNAERP
jgi:hypothetical protein